MIINNFKFVTSKEDIGFTLPFIIIDLLLVLLYVALIINVTIFSIKFIVSLG